MYRLTFTCFIAAGRIALASPTCLLHAQRRFFQKSLFQSNENAAFCAISIGNMNESRRMCIQV
jgi:hypothetical protein